MLASEQQKQPNLDERDGEREGNCVCGFLTNRGVSNGRQYVQWAQTAQWLHRLKSFGKRLMEYVANTRTATSLLLLLFYMFTVGFL